jgi:hypothetical protein
MNRFLELFGHLVQFTYGVWDRIVLRGYYERLQRPENVVYFFRDVCGIPRITPKVLAARTEKYREWLTTYTKRRGVAVLRAPKGARKEEVVAPYFRRFRGNQGLVVVLTSMEQSPTFISYQPRYKPPCGDDYRRLKRAAGKQFLHYYFYVLDPVMGPMSLRVASYLPFSLNCYMNGHSFLMQQLRRAGIEFRPHDNSILSCKDPAGKVGMESRCSAFIRDKARHRCSSPSGMTVGASRHLRFRCRPSSARPIRCTSSFRALSRRALVKPALLKRA